jgi:hypothetical protein
MSLNSVPVYVPPVRMSVMQLTGISPMGVVGSMLNGVAQAAFYIGLPLYGLAGGMDVTEATLLVVVCRPSARLVPDRGRAVRSVRLQQTEHLALRKVKNRGAGLDATFDRGSAFIDWPHLQAGIGMQTWFCDPCSPRQKGTVENTNRPARRWLPRETDPAMISNHHLKMICDRLNATPRKCLGWKTPAEVFREKVLGQGRMIRQNHRSSKVALQVALTRPPNRTMIRA